MKPLDADWLERVTLASDRLTVASVEASGQTRNLEQLWVSGETEQVLELLNGRACIVSSRTTTGGLSCAAGGPLPDTPLKSAGVYEDRGRRLDRLRGGGREPATLVALLGVFSVDRCIEGIVADGCSTSRRSLRKPP